MFSTTPDLLVKETYALQLKYCLEFTNGVYVKNQQFDINFTLLHNYYTFLYLK